MLVVTFKSGASTETHVGKPCRWKYDDVADVVEIQADGDELNRIQLAIPSGIPLVSQSTCPVQRFFGADAQFIVANLFSSGAK